MKIKNSEVRQLQMCLSDIIENINSNINILNSEELSDLCLRPIMKMAIEISDKVFIQTKDIIFDLEI